MDAPDIAAKDMIDYFEALRAELDAVKRERDEARAANERDRTNIIKSYTALSDEFSRRSWLFTSRGSYEWDDTRYQQEFRDAIDAMRPLVEKFRPIGADRTNCPETQAEVDAARIDWKSRAEAAVVEVARLTNENGGLRHKAAVAQIGHDQLNRFIELFDGLGFKGPPVDEQARLVADELRNLRAEIARLNLLLGEKK